MHRHDYLHLHCISGFTTINLDHCHRYTGRTDYAYEQENHVHYFSIYTSFNEGHSHLVYGYTGPPLYLPNGSHYHLFSGRTSEDGLNCHHHDYEGATSLDYPR